jgi:hypothetical protein
VIPSRYRACFAATVYLMLGLAATARGQVVFESEGPYVPYTQPGATPKHGADPTPFSRVYVNVMSGQAQPLTMASDGTLIASNQNGYAYASLDFVFSVTSRMLMEDADASQRAESNALNELKRAIAHVHVEAVAADKKTVLKTSRESPATLTLMMSPSDMAFGETAPSTILPTVSTAISSVPFLGTIAPLVQTFLSSRPQRAIPTFFSYQAADDEFGWTWYTAPSTTVEGTHRCSALLQVTSKAAFVRLTVDFATDWQRFGVWTRQYTFLVPIVPPPAPPAPPKP